MKAVIETIIHEFEELINDHSAISLMLLWKHIKEPTSKFNKTHWNNHNEEKICKWKNIVEKKCLNYS